MSFITAAELKLWLSIPPTDTSRDGLLESLAEAATETCIVEGLGGRDPRRRTRTELLNGRGGRFIVPREYPIMAVTSVTIWPDTTPLPSDRIAFDENRILLRGGVFPLGDLNVTLVYTAGLAELPEAVKLAAKYTAKGMWDARLTDMNSTGESFNGVGGASFWPSGPGALPPQARSLLNGFATRYRT